LEDNQAAVSSVIYKVSVSKLRVIIFSQVLTLKVFVLDKWCSQIEVGFHIDADGILHVSGLKDKDY